MAATSPPRRGVAPHVDSVTLRARLGAGSSAPNHRDKALEAQCARHARRHASDPENHDVLYAWGLTLQERAECAEETAAAAPQQQQQQQQQQRGGTDAAGHARHHGSRATRDAYLRAACDAYAKAISLHPRFPAALYNHGIALGDLARAAQGADAEAATSLWKSACAQYARAVVAAESACEERHHGHRGSGDDARSIVPKASASASARGDAPRVVRVASPTDTVRALNNWGLAEQRLAGLASSAPGRLARLTRAASRFREALRRDPGFHRAAYNLGTVMYALAELAARRARKLEAARGSPEEVETLEALARGLSDQGFIAGATAPAAAAECRAAAAAHICLAAAGADDDASRDAYRASFALVRRALPFVCRDSRSDPADVTPETSRKRFFVFRGSLRRERERGALGGWRAATSFAADHAFFFELHEPPWGAEGGSRDASRDEPRDTVESVECFRDGHTHETDETDETDTRMCVRLADITRVAAAARDASFPTPGFRGNDAASAKAPFGFFTHERDGTARWFVAPDEPSRDLWVDALSLASDIARRGKSGALERELLGV